MSGIPAKQKVVILGLDGLSWPLLNRLINEGVTPRLGELVRESWAGPMASTWPEISPVAWTTFFTGAGPGEHGIYGFTEFVPGDYRVTYNSSADVKTPCLWDWLSLRERRSIVLNVPLTYPARSLSGVMVSGFIALDYERAAYPAVVSRYLAQSGYRLEADFEKVHQDRDIFLKDLDAALSGRSRLLERFWPEEWDLFTLVVTDTDRLHHFFLGEFEERGPILDYFCDFYRRVDNLVGRVIDLADAMDEVTLVLLSDHGFAPVVEEFHLNRWLSAHGYLPRVGPGAAALALDPTRIYFNRRPRFGGGHLNDRDIPALAGELTAGLLAEPAVAEVMNGRDLFSGPRADLAPDLVIRPARGYEFKAKFNPGPVYSPSLLTGTHTWEDAFYLVRDPGVQAGPDNAPGPFKDIRSFGRFVLSLFGIDIITQGVL